MILRFGPDATLAQRDAVLAVLQKFSVRTTSEDGTLVLLDELEAGEAIEVAAMPGVAEIARLAPNQASLREALMHWVAGAATVIGVLAIVAANLSPTIGRPADPLRTPAALRPSWPLIPWYVAEDRAPRWVPVPLLLVLAALVLFFWPRIGRRIAETRPALHTLIGVAALAGVLGLVALEVAR